MDYMSKDFNWQSASPRMVQGRLHFRAPDHPLSVKSKKSGMVGLVNVGRHVASVERGRWLEPSEVVRFNDCDPNNVLIDNLVVVDRKDMPRLVVGYSTRVNLVCPVCNLPFDEVPSHSERRVTCSVECKTVHQRRFEVSKDDLEKLIWEYPTVKVASLFGVSDKAVEKRCKKLCIEKPPRGYWAKMYASQLSPVVTGQAESLVLV